MDTTEVADALRTRLHYATVHAAGPMGTMPIICSVCGLVDVVTPDGFPDRGEQFYHAKKLCKAHVWSARNGEL
jgi:hypothetical protein